MLPTSRKYYYYVNVTNGQEILSCECCWWEGEYYYFENIAYEQEKYYRKNIVYGQEKYYRKNIAYE